MSAHEASPSDLDVELARLRRAVELARLLLAASETLCMLGTSRHLDAGLTGDEMQD